MSCDTDVTVSASTTRRRGSFLLNYSLAKRAQFDIFKARAATLNPVLESEDATKLVRNLDRLIEARPETLLCVPVETFLHMLTYLPLYSDRYQAKPRRRRHTTLDRVMMSSVFGFVLVMENCHVKKPLSAPTASLVPAARQHQREKLLDEWSGNAPSDAARALCRLANLLDHQDELVLLPQKAGSLRRCITKVQCFVEALRLRPDLCEAYAGIGRILSNATNTFTHHDGKVMNRRELYMEGLRHRPNDDWLLRALGSSLDEGEVVTLPDGRETTDLQLFVAAAVKSKGDATYANLSDALPRGDCITMDGRAWSKRDLLVEAWQLSSVAVAPFVLEAWTFLLIVDPSPVPAIPDARLASPEAIALAHLKEAPTHWVTLYYLGRYLAREGRTVDVAQDNNTVTMSCDDCFIKSLVDGGGECYPWLQLSKRAQHGPLALPDGCVMNRADLLSKALQLMTCTTLHAIVDDHFYCTQVTLQLAGSSRGPLQCDANKACDYVLDWFSVPTGMTLQWQPQGNARALTLLRGLCLSECGITNAYGDYMLEGPVLDEIATCAPPPSDLVLKRQLGADDFGPVWAAQFQGRPVVATRTPRGSALRYNFEVLRCLDPHSNLRRVVGTTVVLDETERKHHAWVLTEAFNGAALCNRAGSAKMTTRDVIALGLQLCAALQHFQARCGSHLDITPRNVLISTSGEQVQLGYPILLRCDVLWNFKYHRNPHVDIHHYSPEACAAVTAPLGPHTDVYGIGATMWFAVTGGCKPWGDETAQEDIVRRMVSGETCPSPLSCCPLCCCTTELDSLIAECMSNAHDKRPTLPTLELRLKAMACQDRNA